MLNKTLIVSVMTATLGLMLNTSATASGQLNKYGLTSVNMAFVKASTAGHYHHYRHHRYYRSGYRYRWYGRGYRYRYPHYYGWRGYRYPRYYYGAVRYYPRSYHYPRYGYYYPYGYRRHYYRWVTYPGVYYAKVPYVAYKPRMRGWRGWRVASHGRVPRGAVVKFYRKGSPVFYCRTKFAGRHYRGDLISGRGCVFFGKGKWRTNKHYSAYVRK